MPIAKKRGRQPRKGMTRRYPGAGFKRAMKKKGKPKAPPAKPGKRGGTPKHLSPKAKAMRKYDAETIQARRTIEEDYGIKRGKDRTKLTDKQIKKLMRGGEDPPR